jgi:hypothetical protein
MLRLKVQFPSTGKAIRHQCEDLSAPWVLQQVSYHHISVYSNTSTHALRHYDSRRTWFLGVSVDLHSTLQFSDQEIDLEIRIGDT